MIKVTFTLDEESVARLDRMSERFRVPKSQVVREAIRVYGEQASRLSAEERKRMLEIFDAVTPNIPHRSRDAVEADLEEVRVARRTGGRRTGRPEGS
jgi:metal-responsive CopG/Arc/MetJ family transcriptional regulator